MMLMLFAYNLLAYLCCLFLECVHFPSSAQPSLLEFLSQVAQVP